MNTDITKQMEMVLYRTEDDYVTVSALIKDENIWATNILKKYMIKGFAMDDQRLKLAKAAFGKDYFRDPPRWVHATTPSQSDEKSDKKVSFIYNAVSTQAKTIENLHKKKPSGSVK